MAVTRRSLVLARIAALEAELLRDLRQRLADMEAARLARYAVRVLEAFRKVTGWTDDLALHRATCGECRCAPGQPTYDCPDSPARQIGDARLALS